jgi:hypothetical protein
MAREILKVNGGLKVKVGAPEREMFGLLWQEYCYWSHIANVNL